MINFNFKSKSCNVPPPRPASAHGDCLSVLFVTRCIPTALGWERCVWTLAHGLEALRRVSEWSTKDRTRGQNVASVAASSGHFGPAFPHVRSRTRPEPWAPSSLPHLPPPARSPRSSAFCRLRFPTNSLSFAAGIKSRLDVALPPLCSTLSALRSRPSLPPTCPLLSERPSLPIGSGSPSHCPRSLMHAAGKCLVKWVLSAPPPGRHLLTSTWPRSLAARALPSDPGAVGHRGALAEIGVTDHR